MRHTTIIVDYHDDEKREYVTAQEGIVYNGHRNEQFHMWTLRREQHIIHVMAMNCTISSSRARDLARSYVDEPKLWRKVDLNE